MAFSFLELLLVLIILAVLGAVALPRYANFIARRRAESAATRLAADLAMVQEQARYYGVAQTVTFNVAGNSYSLVGMKHPDRPSQAYVISLSDEPYRAAIVSADFGGDAQIIFDGYGTPDSGGSAVLQVGGVTRSVSISAENGAASVSSIGP